MGQLTRMTEHLDVFIVTERLRLNIVKVLIICATSSLFVLRIST